MPLIYVHAFYSMSAHPTQHYIFEDAKELPDRCDLIAVAYFHWNLDLIIAELEQLVKKTSNLLIYLAEFNNDNLFSLLKDPRWQHCKFFYNMVPTADPTDHRSVLCWTHSGHNMYLEDSWAQKQLSQIDNQISASKKRFDCLLGRQRPHRDFVEQCYKQSKFQDQIIFRYHTDHSAKPGVWTDGINDLPIARYQQIPYDIYSQSYFSVIAETTASYSDFSYFTEKTAKPIVAKRLFVFFAAKNYIKNLRKLGFQTFDGIIDESYDQIDNDQERWRQAWQQVESLCERDIQTLLDQIRPIVQHNFDHYMRTDWLSSIRQEFQKLNCVNK